VPLIVSSAAGGDLELSVHFMAAGTGFIQVIADDRVKKVFSAVTLAATLRSRGREHNAQNTKIAGYVARAHKRATSLSRP
jgi:hypothetical protein